MFRRTADFVCRSSVFPAGILSVGKFCVTKIGKICSERQIYKKNKGADAAPFRKREVSPYAHKKKWARTPRPAWRKIMKRWLPS